MSASNGTFLHSQTNLADSFVDVSQKETDKGKGDDHGDENSQNFLVMLYYIHVHPGQSYKDFLHRIFAYPTFSGQRHFLGLH